jgi:hypothetical protein
MITYIIAFLRSAFEVVREARAMQREMHRRFGPITD